MRSRLYAVARAAILFTAALGAYGQEGSQDGVLDDLFESPTTDAVVVDTGIDHTVLYGDDERLRLSGFFRALSGAIIGYRDWPDVSDPGYAFDADVGVVAEAVLSIDARPSSVAGLHGDFSTEFSPSESSFTWSDFDIRELYLDYILADAAFFRVGQFESVWGQGRIFTPSNLMDGSEDGFSMRLSMPTLLRGVTSYVLGSGEVDSAEDLTYAMKADLLLFDTYLSGGLLYKYVSGYTGLVSAKKVVFGTDLFADTVVSCVDDTFSYEGLAGFYREWTDVRLYGEYYFKANEVELLDHKLGLAFGLKDILTTKVDLGIKWEHSLSDDSGVCLTALTWTPLKYIKATVGVPVVYGDVGTYYVDTSYLYNEDETLEVGLSGYRIGIIASLSMKIPF